MSSEWISAKLGDLVDIKHGFAFKGEFFSDQPTRYQLTTPGNFAIGGGFQPGKGKFYNGPIPDDYVLKAGDLLVTMTDLSRAADTLGYAAKVPPEQEVIWLHNQRVGLVKAKTGAAISEGFLHYLMRSSEYRHWVVSTATGSTVKHTSPSRICDYEFLLPALDYQEEVARVLEALDDRITLLRETNATLEAIAQALFKSWFVDFDPVRSKMEGRTPEGMDEATAALFPDGFETSELGEVPRGWQTSPLQEQVEGVYDGPHATPPAATEGGVFLGIKNLTGTALDLSDVRFIADADWERWTKRVTPRARDIVFSYEATLGFFALIPPNLRCCLGRRLALVRPKERDGFPHFWFHQFVAAPFQALLEKHTIHGATVNRIALKSFPDLPVLVPLIELRRAFDSTVAELWERIHCNEAKVATLSTLRDTLLPRLISGQLRLPEAQAAAEAALGSALQA
ncbi:MAG: restriction endonuclease subunit S [Gammaproteobacteria bacterium]